MRWRWRWPASARTKSMPPCRRAQQRRDGRAHCSTGWFGRQRTSAQTRCQSNSRSGAPRPRTTAAASGTRPPNGPRRPPAPRSTRGTWRGTARSSRHERCSPTKEGGRSGEYRQCRPTIARARTPWSERQRRRTRTRPTRRGEGREGGRARSTTNEALAA